MLNHNIKFIAMAVIMCGICYVLSRYIYFNPSSSEPIGHYLVYVPFSYHRNDRVLLCLTKATWVGLAHKLGLPSEDTCSGQMPYLLKQIVAVPGDTVFITTQGIRVNDKYFKDSVSLNSYKGLALHPYKVGTFLHLAQGQFFLLGQGKFSYDSRYFGVIDKKDIHYKAILLYGNVRVLKTV